MSITTLYLERKVSSVSLINVSLIITDVTPFGSFFPLDYCLLQGLMTLVGYALSIGFFGGYV